VSEKRAQTPESGRMTRFAIAWNWPPMIGAGRDWYDGPHYYLHLGFVGLSWSP
jgi:hypothetical protein